MKRTIIAMVTSIMLVATAFARPAPSSADLVWCWTDPVLVINGKVVNIKVGVPEAQRHSAKSSLTVTVPANVSAILAGTNAANFPVDVRLVQSGTYDGSGPIPVTATAVVAAPDETPSALTAWQPSVGTVAQTTGRGGKPMTITFGLQ